MQEQPINPPTPHDPRGRRENRARIHNWIGHRLYRLATEAPNLDARGLFEQAIDQLRAATEESPDWYLPYENRADLTSYLGEIENDPRRQLDAIGLYDRAIKLAKVPAGYIQGQDWEQLAGGNVLQLEISKTVCQVLSGSPDQVDAALNEIERRWLPFGPIELQGPVVTYTLACLFARITAYWREHRQRHEAENYRRRSVRALAEAFARWPKLLDDARGDPDLKAIAADVKQLDTTDWVAIAKLSAPGRQSAVDSVLRETFGGHSDEPPAGSTE